MKIFDSISLKGSITDNTMKIDTEYLVYTDAKGDPISQCTLKA